VHGAELDVEIKHFARAYHEPAWQNHKAGHSADNSAKGAPAAPHHQSGLLHFQSAYDDVRHQFTSGKFL
jgi:hypothetical protein